MVRRWARWIGLGVLLVVLLALGTWRLLREIPGLLANAEDTIRREAEALGFRVSFRDVRFHPLHLRLSLEDLNIRDGIADIPLAHADHVELSLSPRRILSGLSPVSRVLVRTYSVQAGEANRPLLETLRASGKEGGGGGGRCASRGIPPRRRRPHRSHGTARAVGGEGPGGANPARPVSRDACQRGGSTRRRTVCPAGSGERKCALRRGGGRLLLEGRYYSGPQAQRIGASREALFVRAVGRGSACDGPEILRGDRYRGLDGVRSLRRGLAPPRGASGGSLVLCPGGGAP